MGLALSYIDGQTPLDEDEKEGLLVQTIATRSELDEFEQKNIEEAILWLLNKSLKKENIFTEKFICDLHKRMYGSVWSWAGKFRKTNKNLGVDKHQIPVDLRNLCDDAIYWIAHNVYPPEEIAIRFKHRIVSIHCFPNGNGRHSRLMADIIINKVYGKPLFNWGAGDLVHKGKARNMYLNAIRSADKGNFESLLAFAKS